MFKSINQWTISGLLLITSIHAHAFEAWTTEQVIQSVTAEAELFVKIVPKDNQSGRVILSQGSAQYSINVVDENTIEMVLTQSPVIESIVYKVDKKDCAEMNDCSAKQVITRTNVEKITLTGSEQQVGIQMTEKICSLYGSTGPQHEECEISLDEKAGDFLMSATLKPKKLGLKAGDRIVVATPGFTNAYLQLNQDSSVRVLDSTWGNVEYEATQLQSWELDGEYLILNEKNGGRLSIAKTQEFDGVSRIAGFYQNGEAARTFMGGLVVDHNIDLTQLTVPEVSGFYRTVLVGTSGNSVYSFGYEFNNDGTGGFETHYAGSTDPHRTNWLWTLDYGQMVARQYVDKESNRPIEDYQEMKSCQAMVQELDSSCLLRVQRSYKLIAQDGNRYTMIRTMDWHTGDDLQPNEHRLSIWVFYKK